MIKIDNSLLKKLITINKNVWDRFNNNENATQPQLLVEYSTALHVSHKLGVWANIICKAYNLSPLWIAKLPLSSKIDDRLNCVILSYNKNANIVEIQRITNLIDYIRYWITFKFLKFRIKKVDQILSIKLNGIKIGDIVYDTYIYKKYATISQIDDDFYNHLDKVIYYYYVFLFFLKKSNIKGILVTHTISKDSGLICRIALKLGIKVYQPLRSLKIYRELKTIYSHKIKPDSKEVEFIYNLNYEKVNSEFAKLTNSDKLSNSKVIPLGVKLAYSKQKNIFNDRAEFAKQYRIDHKKKNIFVMLHAFNDNPNTSSTWSIFRDYYQWFKETLDFALEFREVNWIFKNHPAAKFYTYKDVSLDQLFSKISQKHIVYINEYEPLNSKSIPNIGDVIITAAGSAGFEFPCWGIPAIVTSDSFYCNLGFTIEVNTKREYKELLKNIDTIDKLSPKEQHRARCFFLWMYKRSFIDYNWEIDTSLQQVEELKSIDDQFDCFVPKILDIYENGNAENIIDLCNKYSDKLKGKGHLMDFLIK